MDDTPELVRLGSHENGKLTKTIFWMALPVLCEQILVLCVTMSDYFLTGKYLEMEHIAAICSAGYITWMMQSIFCFVSIGTTTLVARYIGAGNTEKACQAANQSLMIGFWLLLATILFWIVGMDGVINFLSLTGVTADYTREYLWIIVPSLPFVMLAAVGLAALRGAGNMYCGLWIMGIVNVINLAVSWLLVLGPGPFPAMGWRGVAIGTAVGFVVGGVLTAALLIRGSYGIKFKIRQLFPNIPMIHQLLWISVPGGIDMMTIIGCQFWFLGLINSLGVIASASHGVGLRIESLGSSALVACSITVQTIVGQFLGANRVDMAVKSARIMLAMGMAFIIIPCLIFWFWSDSLPYLFITYDRTDIAAETSPLLKTIALGLPAFAYLMVYTGFLRGAGDTICALCISLFGFLCVRIVLTYALSFGQNQICGFEYTGWGLGVLGAWIAMVVDIAVRGFLVWGRCHLQFSVKSLRNTTHDRWANQPG